MYAAPRLGATSTVWPNASTRWVGGVLADGRGIFPTGPKQPNDPRKIAEPSYFWGGEGGRPVYVVEDWNDWRVDLYLYDVDGVVVDNTTPGGSGFSQGGGIIPINPVGVKRTGELNPPYEMTMTSGTGTGTSTSTTTTTTTTSSRRARPVLLIAGVAAALLALSPSR